MDAAARLRLLEQRDTTIVHLAAARIQHRAALDGDSLDRAFAPTWARVVAQAEANLARINADLAALPDDRSAGLGALFPEAAIERAA